MSLSLIVRVLSFGTCQFSGRNRNSLEPSIFQVFFGYWDILKRPVTQKIPSEHLSDYGHHTYSLTYEITCLVGVGAAGANVLGGVFRYSKFVTVNDLSTFLAIAASFWGQLFKSSKRHDLNKSHIIPEIRLLRRCKTANLSRV